MAQHFGQWVRRLRNKAGVSQQTFAHALQMSSYAGIALLEERETPNGRGSTLEALMEIAGARDREAFDEMWRAGTFPDRDVLVERINRLAAMRRPKAMGNLKLPRETIAGLKQLAEAVDPSMSVADYLAEHVRVVGGVAFVSRSSPQTEPLRGASRSPQESPALRDP